MFKIVGWDEVGYPEFDKHPSTYKKDFVVMNSGDICINFGTITKQDAFSVEKGDYEEYILRTKPLNNLGFVTDVSFSFESFEKARDQCKIIHDAICDLFEAGKVECLKGSVFLVNNKSEFKIAEITSDQLSEINVDDNGETKANSFHIIPEFDMRYKSGKYFHPDLDSALNEIRTEIQLIENTFR